MLLTAVAPQGWPQFRGPSGQGLAGDADVPLEWAEGKNVAWKTAVSGKGWSSPVVVDGRVWLTTSVSARDGSSLRLLGFDAGEGRPIVDVEVFRIWRDAQSTNLKNSDASPTPVVAGHRVYVHFGAHGTAALTTAGEIVWKTRLPYESQHGNGGSPILHGDLLIINCDGFDQAFVVALDAATGRQKWRRSRRQPWSQAYSTPLAIRVGDADQIVSVGASYTTALEPLTGREIWRVYYRDGFSNVPRPVFGHGLVYITTGFQQPSLLAIRPDGTGEVTKTHVAWTHARGVPFTPSPILAGDELYVVNDLGILQCLEARTGDPIWIERLGGTFSASPVLAAGRLYFSNEEGATTVLAPGRTFTRLAVNTLDGAILASPAVADGALFIRTESHLYRVQAAGRPAASPVSRPASTPWPAPASPRAEAAPTRPPAR
ncbi:MAG TPA: PQQ-binding-like beta-propeller repeat protein [Vicinamibacterales bacterium]|nr:PQQ-binding-like beta-propeller repeat protein [Vicinamibacterales bacterium]